MPHALTGVAATMHCQPHPQVVRKGCIGGKRWRTRALVVKCSGFCQPCEHEPELLLRFPNGLGDVRSESRKAVLSIRLTMRTTLLAKTRVLSTTLTHLCVTSVMRQPRRSGDYERRFPEAWGAEKKQKSGFVNQAHYEPHAPRETMAPSWFGKFCGAKKQFCQPRG